MNCPRRTFLFNIQSLMKKKKPLTIRFTGIEQGPESVCLLAHNCGHSSGLMCIPKKSCCQLDIYQNSWARTTLSASLDLCVPIGCRCLSVLTMHPTIFKLCPCREFKTMCVVHGCPLEYFHVFPLEYMAESQKLFGLCSLKYLSLLF